MSFFLMVSALLDNLNMDHYRTIERPEGCFWKQLPRVIFHDVLKKYILTLGRYSSNSKYYLISYFQIVLCYAELRVRRRKLLTSIGWHRKCVDVDEGKKMARKNVETTCWFFSASQGRSKSSKNVFGFRRTPFQFKFSSICSSAKVRHELRFSSE